MSADMAFCLFCLFMDLTFLSSNQKAGRYLVCQAGKIYVLERAEEHCYSAGGWPSSSKGGDTYADYFNFSCVWSDHHSYCKKQQPPLGKVTVVYKIN